MKKNNAKQLIRYSIFWMMLIFCLACEGRIKNNKSNFDQINKSVTAKDILGNPDYLAMSYGGYRGTSRDAQPTLTELKDDMKILHAMGVRIVRTYNVHLAQATNLLEAISQLIIEEEDFEMYVMLGAWIDCKHAWTDKEPDHNSESDRNSEEIETATRLAKKYPEIVKIVAVGNEAMINWADAYYVQPSVILKWVIYLQNLKKSGVLPSDLWITSSDDFASWGGGDDSYHNLVLENLISAVDYISMHSYPYHNTHYNPDFWQTPESEKDEINISKIDNAMKRAVQFSMAQYDSVASYMRGLGIEKPIHIGETGWATISNGYYGDDGSKATDEYKQGLYYKYMREWTNANNISCFYFEAFDEHWKDAANPNGSENHFGLFTIDGQAKYPIWDLVDQGVFEGMGRNNKTIIKTYNGNKDALLKDVKVPPSKN